MAGPIIRHMGFDLPDPQLKPGEHVVWGCAAQRSIPRRTFVAGWLFLTERRIVFQPNRLNIGIASRDLLSYELRDCLGAEVIDRTWTLYDGGTRRRIRLNLADGTSVLFVVKAKHTNEVATRLSDVIAAAAPAAATAP
jgi:hypothetical protein